MDVKGASFRSLTCREAAGPGSLVEWMPHTPSLGMMKALAPPCTDKQGRRLVGS